MQDIQAEAARALELEFEVPGPGRLAVLVKLDRGEAGDITAEVVGCSHAPAGADAYVQMMVMNVPEGVPRLIGMAGVVELLGIDEESVGEFALAGDFPKPVQLRGLKRKLWWMHEVIVWREGHVIPGDAENFSYGARRRPHRNRNAHLRPKGRRREDR